jgi:hypothetical protein
LDKKVNKYAGENKDGQAGKKQLLAPSDYIWQLCTYVTFRNMAAAVLRKLHGAW